MTSLTEYDDVASDVVAELSGVRDKLYAAGVLPEQIIIDPGIGFSKNDDQNWELLGNLDQLEALGHKVLVGASRKRFLGTLLTVCRQGRAPGGTRRRHRRHHGHQRRPRGLGCPRARRRIQPGRRQGRRPHGPQTRPLNRQAPMDRITLSGVTAIGYHGVFDFERREGQPFVVDAVLHLDFSQGRGVGRRPGHRPLRRGGRADHGLDHR